MLVSLLKKYGKLEDFYMTKLCYFLLISVINERVVVSKNYCEKKTDELLDFAIKHTFKEKKCIVSHFLNLFICLKNSFKVASYKSGTGNSYPACFPHPLLWHVLIGWTHQVISHE